MAQASAQSGRWLVTGLNGTLAPVVARVAEGKGIRVFGWDRSHVSPDDVGAADRWLRQEKPDAIAHLAMGSIDWAQQLARYASEHSRPFLFTSTAMVFHHVPDGPHAVNAERNAQDEYGRYKKGCEDAILSAYPAASVVRIGWQIDPVQPGNNMLLALDQWQANRGHVSASRAWRPACSFMQDTAAAIVGLLQRPVAGPSHLDSNADEGHSFLEIVLALKRQFQRGAWDVRATEDYVHDQRLLGGRSVVPPLSNRLPSLKRLSGDA